MATRATIEIQGISFAKVYKHWDGYPASMTDWLKDFNKSFTEKRGIDPEYKFAQLLRFSAKHAEEYDLDNSEFTGWGVIPYSNDVGEEYSYVLKEDGDIEVDHL